MKGSSEGRKKSGPLIRNAASRTFLPRYFPCFLDRAFYDAF